MCVHFFRLTVFHRQHSLVVYLMSVGVCFLSTYMCLGTVGLCLDTCIHQSAGVFTMLQSIFKSI